MRRHRERGYDPAEPTEGTLVALSAPHSSPRGLYGVTVVSAAVALSSWAWISTGYRHWRRRRVRGHATDHREDPWAGTSDCASLGLQGPLHELRQRGLQLR